ncbi:MAG: VWA domain-containing protein [Candidatus Muiribacteriaceae bacterium]
MRLEKLYYLILLIPVLILIYLKLRIYENRLNFSYNTLLKPREFRTLSRYILRGAALILLVIAIAGPQYYREREVFYGEGLDIMMVLDISTSMRATDFKPDRLEASKAVMKSFIENRKNDRIGFVIFAAKALNWVPFTVDHEILNDFIDKVGFKQDDKGNVISMLPDGTAIGTAIATAVSRFERSESRSQIVILLTDGVNNSGNINPVTAADTAKEKDVKIYTIGVGTDGYFSMPVRTAFGTVNQKVRTEIDEELLKKIAAKTGGKYYRADDEKKLRKIYEEIDELEKTEIESDIFSITKEYFQYFVYAALILMAIEMVMFDILGRRIP